jgi:hypothetical protein
LISPDWGVLRNGNAREAMAVLSRNVYCIFLTICCGLANYLPLGFKIWAFGLGLSGAKLFKEARANRRAR